VEQARPTISREEAQARYGVASSHRVAAIAPGSREQEIHYLLPVLLRAAAKLEKQFPGMHFLIPAAPSLQREWIASSLSEAGLKVTLLEGMDYNALQLAEAAVVCSGSATLEFACLGIPMVVVYRASRLTTLQFRLVRGVIGGQRFAAMPNIIAGREVVPELLGSAAEPGAICQQLAGFLEDRGRCARVRADLDLVVTTLGPPGASQRTAAMVLELIGQGEKANVSVLA